MLRAAGRLVVMPGRLGESVYRANGHVEDGAAVGIVDRRVGTAFEQGQGGLVVAEAAGVLQGRQAVSVDQGRIGA